MAVRSLLGTWNYTLWERCLNGQWCQGSFLVQTFLSFLIFVLLKLGYELHLVYYLCNWWFFIRIKFVTYLKKKLQRETELIQKSKSLLLNVWNMSIYTYYFEMFSIFTNHTTTKITKPQSQNPTKGYSPIYVRLGCWL